MLKFQKILIVRISDIQINYHSFSPKELSSKWADREVFQQEYRFGIASFFSHDYDLTDLVFFKVSVVKSRNLGR